MNSDSSSYGADIEKQESQCCQYVQLMTPVQKLYCCFAVMLELYLMWFWQQPANHQQQNVWGILHLMLLFFYPRSEVKEGELPQEAREVVTAQKPSRPSKARSYYLDNVKIFCTELVLIHHISIDFGADGGSEWAMKIGNFKSPFGTYLTSWLTSVCQSFFMSLLFFVSGVFTPSSFERKGTVEFVRDKLWRLGWPLIATFFIAMPLLRGLWGVVLIGGSWNEYAQAGQAVTWFLCSLVIFNIVYSIAPFPKVVLPFPSVLQLIVAGVLLGALEGLTVYFSYSAPFTNVLLDRTGGMPFDVAFFAAGCVAKRSGWLEAISEMSKVQYWFARIVCLAIWIWNGVMLSKVHPSPYVECGLAPTRRLLSEEHAQPLERFLAPLRLLQGAFNGILTTMLSTVVLHFFAVHLNSQNRFTKIASEGQYGVYVMQTLTIPCVLWSFVKILEASGEKLEFLYCAETPTSQTVIGTEWLVGGWLYTIVLVTAIAWPLAYYFRQLPGVNSIL